MKRYGIPLLVIAILTTAAYAWRTSVAKHERIRHQRKAHMDSLSHFKPSRTFANSYDNDTPFVQDFSKSITTMTSGLPDSIRPEDFSEIKHAIPTALLDRIREGGDEGEDIDLDGEEMAYSPETGYDTVANLAAAKRGYLRGEFIRATVMKMLFRHLKNPADADEFGRCPSGYFTNQEMVHPDSDNWQPRIDSLGWRYENVYFGEGCDDTLVCKYRFQYEKRWVEMKDPNAANYVSLRTYEVMKFGNKLASALSINRKEQ